MWCTLNSIHDLRCECANKALVFWLESLLEWVLSVLFLWVELQNNLILTNTVILLHIYLLDLMCGKCVCVLTLNDWMNEWMNEWMKKQNNANSNMTSVWVCTHVHCCHGDIVWIARKDLSTNLAGHGCKKRVLHLHGLQCDNVGPLLHWVSRVTWYTLHHPRHRCM